MVWMRGSVDPAPISIAGPLAARGSIWVSDPPYQTTIWASKPRPAAKKIIGSKGRSSEDENANCCDYYKLQVYGCCAPLSLSVCESCRKVRVPPMSAGSQGVTVTDLQPILTSTAHPLKLNFYNFRESVMTSAMAGGD